MATVEEVAKSLMPAYGPLTLSAEAISTLCTKAAYARESINECQHVLCGMRPDTVAQREDVIRAMREACDAYENLKLVMDALREAAEIQGSEVTVEREAREILAGDRHP